MKNQRYIRADFDRESIIIYQAYSGMIAKPALEKQKFVSPFSFNRMTWIKPSFLWLMKRSDWGRKSGQEFILSIRMKRTGWDKALSLGVLTSPEKDVYKNTAEWKKEFDDAIVHIQWDPERSLRGTILPYDSIQVGLSRKIIEQFVNEWIVTITDMTPLVKKLHELLKKGEYEKAKRLLPAEKEYIVNNEIKKRLAID